MKIVLITNGKLTDIPALASLTGLGYAVEMFKYIPYEECDLKDLTPDPALKLLCIRDTPLSKFENSLRASWAAMLDKYADVDEPIIFGECDACPRIHSNALNGYVAAAKKVDLVRLYYWLEVGSPDRMCSAITPISYRDVLIGLRMGKSPAEFVPGETVPTERWRIECGTHAFLSNNLPARKVIANLFRTTALPVDITLMHAVMTGELNMLTTRNNLFVQDELHQSENVR